MAKLRIYGDFNDFGAGVCWLLRYRERPLDEQAEELNLRDGMPVILFYEDPAEEFEFDAVLEFRPDEYPTSQWVARVDESSYRLIRETSLEILRAKGIVP